MTIGQFLPGIRGLISIPAGVARMNVGLFLLANLIGTLVWCTVLAVAGRLLGRNFTKIHKFLGPTGWAILGVMVSLTSVGAGAMGTVMLLYLYPLRMNPSRLVGTDIVHAIPLTIVAGTGYLLMGNVDLHLLGNLLIGSIPGVLIGTLIASRAPEVFLRTAIALILATVACKLLFS